jgi:hypothetical protein
MVGRALRAALFAALVLALWTLARPAHAAFAPFCDDRGATALAAPPAIEAPDEAIRRTLASSCEHEKVEFGLSVRAQRKSTAPLSDGSEKGWQSQVSSSGPAPGEMLESVPVQPSPCIGVRVRVERPPRI